jgi:hypothetical protein
MPTSSEPKPSDQQAAPEREPVRLPGSFKPTEPLFVRLASDPKPKTP